MNPKSALNAEKSSNLFLFFTAGMHAFVSRINAEKAGKIIIYIKLEGKSVVMLLYSIMVNLQFELKPFPP